MGNSARTCVDSKTGVGPPTLVQPKPPIRVILLKHLEAGLVGQPVEFLVHKVMHIAQSFASVSPIEQKIRRVDIVRTQSGLRPGDNPAAHPGAI